MNGIHHGAESFTVPVSPTPRVHQSVSILAGCRGEEDESAYLGSSSGRSGGGARSRVGIDRRSAFAGSGRDLARVGDGWIESFRNVGREGGDGIGVSVSGGRRV